MDTKNAKPEGGRIPRLLVCLIKLPRQNQDRHQLRIPPNFENQVSVDGLHASTPSFSR